MNSEQKENILMDKMIISNAVIYKENQLISFYNKIIDDLGMNYYSLKDLSKTPDFKTCWRIMAEMFDFLEDNKIQKIFDKKDSNKEDIETIRGLIEKYNNLDWSLNFQDLKTAYRILKRLVSLCGYHEDDYHNPNAPIDYESLYDAL